MYLASRLGKFYAILPFFFSFTWTQAASLCFFIFLEGEIS